MHSIVFSDRFSKHIFMNVIVVSVCEYVCVSVPIYLSVSVYLCVLVAGYTAPLYLRTGP